jgi:hypothetical protein
MPAMKKLILPIALSLVVAAGLWACKKKGPSSPSNETPNTGGFSSTPAVAGQPSNMDLARLAGRFGTIGAAVLQQTLSGSSGTSSVLANTPQTQVAAPSALAVPAAPSTVGAFFLCCADTASTSLQVTGSVGAGTSGTIPVSLSYSSSGPLQWTGVNAGAAWELTFQSATLTMTGTLTTAGGAVGSNQQITLVGGLQYKVPGTANTFVLPVSLTFAYPDLGASATNDAGASLPVTTSGSIGSLQLSASQVPSVTMTGRCSAPQEACGALVSGQCPCTKWPPCPSYGLSCPGTFK